MQNQTQNPDQDSGKNKNQEQPILKESPLLTMPKLVLIASFIVVFCAVLGVAGYCLTKKKPIVSPAPKTISAIEISADKKSILNSKTKEVIFTINDAQKYLKNSGYAYDPDTFQTTNAKYAGDCFLDAALSNNKDRIVFSSGCLGGDLPQAWVGVYDMSRPCSMNADGDWTCLHVVKIKFSFLIGGSGRNFVWSQDDKTITYEADLGLSGLTETRTIDSVTGKILERENISVTDDSETKDWQTYRNEEYGYEVKYPNNWEGIETSFVTDYASFTPEKRDMTQSGFWIRVYKNLKDLTTKEWWNKEYIKRNAVYESKEEFVIAGIVADVYKEKDGLEFNYYVFSESGNIYLILSQLADDKINQILSTFKFIEKKIDM